MTINSYFKDGKADGKSKISLIKKGFDHKYYFDGTLVWGMKEGQGHEINEKGDDYKGMFSRDKKEGKGVQSIKATWITYEGTW